jgi:hypothetical protein
MPAVPVEDKFRCGRRFTRFDGIGPDVGQDLARLVAKRNCVLEQRPKTVLSCWKRLCPYVEDERDPQQRGRFGRPRRSVLHGYGSPRR